MPFGKIGKNTRSKDHNAAHRVLSQAIVNKNAYFNGCVHCIKTTKFHICGTIFRLGMVKESMMEPEHVSKQPYEERN